MFSFFVECKCEPTSHQRGQSEWPSSAGPANSNEGASEAPLQLRLLVVGYVCHPEPEWATLLCKCSLDSPLIRPLEADVDEVAETLDNLIPDGEPVDLVMKPPWPISSPVL